MTNLVLGVLGAIIGAAIAFMVGRVYGINGLIVLLVAAVVVFVAACFGERRR